MRLIDKLYGDFNAKQTIISHFNKGQQVQQGPDAQELLEKLNDGFLKSRITPETYEAAVQELDELVKGRTVKYIKREGGPGHYRYIYKEGEGPKGKSEEKDVEHKTDLKEGDKVRLAGGSLQRVMEINGNTVTLERGEKAHISKLFKPSGEAVISEKKDKPQGKHVGDMSDKELHAAAKELGVKDHEGLSGNKLKTAVTNANVEKQLADFKKKKEGQKIEKTTMSSVSPLWGGGMMISGYVNGEKRINKIKGADADIVSHHKDKEAVSAIYKRLLIDEFDPEVDKHLKKTKEEILKEQK